MPDTPQSPTPPGSGTDHGDRMQRIRVGLTGLAVVLLLIALATTVFNKVSDAGNSSGQNSAKTVDQSKDEPLADLGVAPGAPSNETAPTPPVKGSR